MFYHKDEKTGKESVKIGDLGVAKLLDKENAFTETMVGTVQYLSPEICSGQPYNYKTDVWALGAYKQIQVHIYKYICIHIIDVHKRYIYTINIYIYIHNIIHLCIYNIKMHIYIKK